MKRIIFISMAMLFISQTIMAQVSSDNYAKFEKSFTTNVSYPINLIRNCKAIFCLLKLEMDENNHVITMALSDSADSLFKTEFTKNREKIDIASLESYVKKEFTGVVSRTYIIPLNYFILYNDSCPPQGISTSILESYYKFNSKQIDGNVTILQPIGVKLMIHN